LIGWSWGAWLGFIFAAEYPRLVDKLIMVAAPPFEERYVADIMATRLGRLPATRSSEALSLMKSLDDPAIALHGEAMDRLYKIFLRTDSLDPLPHEEEVLEFQYRVYRGVWEQASALRRSGELLEMGKRIQCPVIALHGDYDPHPPEGVREPLSRSLSDFRFILLAGCGHYPWLERTARREFFTILAGEL